MFFQFLLCFFSLCCVLLVFYCFVFYFSQLFFIVLFNFCSVFLSNFHCFFFYFCFVQPPFFFSYFFVTSIVFISISVMFFHCYVEPWWFLRKLNVQNERGHTEKNCNLKMLATRLGDISSWGITAVTLNQILQSKWQKETRTVIKSWV